MNDSIDREDMPAGTMPGLESGAPSEAGQHSGGTTKPRTPCPLSPSFIGERGFIERTAKLFETGEYPDKGVTITVENLQSLAEGFGEPVPVLIEHGESPLELGYLTAVKAMGDELFGSVSLTPEANRLIESSGARALSLGLTPDLSAIREVSLVRTPRIETAQLFGGLAQMRQDRDAEAPSYGPVFHGLLDEWQDGASSTPTLEGEELARAAEHVFAGDEAPPPGPLPQFRFAKPGRGRVARALRPTGERA